METGIRLLVFLYLYKSLSCYTFTGESESYMKFQQWDATTNGSLSFRFKTYKSKGLLVYTDNSRSNSSIRSAVSIELCRSKLFITIQMGADDDKSKRDLYVGEKLNDMKWHTVQLHRKQRETKVILDGETVYIINDGDTRDLALHSGLFVGGVPDNITEENGVRRVFQNFMSAPRFTGCIESIRFSHSHEVGPGSKKNTPTTVRTPEEIKGVNNGCLDACANLDEKQMCRNHGKCQNKFTKFDCDCKGTGFDGRLCMNVSDSIQFDGQSYITLRSWPTKLLRAYLAELATCDVRNPGPLSNVATTDLSFRFRTNRGNGVIFAAQNNLDHIMFELYNATLRFSIDLGGGHNVAVIRNIPFNDGIWHLVEITRTGRRTQIVVDKSFRYCVNSTTTGIHPGLDLRKSSLYVGGHPNQNLLEAINSKSKSNFTGCLQQAHFNGVDIVYEVHQNSSSLIETYGTTKKGCNI